METASMKARWTYRVENVVIHQIWERNQIRPHHTMMQQLCLCHCVHQHDHWSTALYHTCYWYNCRLVVLVCTGLCVEIRRPYKRNTRWPTRTVGIPPWTYINRHPRKNTHHTPNSLGKKFVVFIMDSSCNCFVTLTRPNDVFLRT